MSSLGSGKTAMLWKTISRLIPNVRTAIIVGDVGATNDADRLAKTGAPVVQVNTDAFGGDCHFAAYIIAKVAENFTLEDVHLLIVENVGNLVRPA